MLGGRGNETKPRRWCDVRELLERRREIKKGSRERGEVKKN